MTVVFIVLGLILLFSGTAWALRTSGRRATRPATRPREPVRPPGAVPIERLSADLVRLHSALLREENQVRRPAKYTRVQALRAAYLDLLNQASRQLEVPPPVVRRGRGVSRAELFRVEAALRERGLDVRRVHPAATSAG